MGRWKAAMKKMLFPGWRQVCLAAFLGGASLALTFLVLGTDHPFSYISYMLSAYGLVVLIAAVAPLFSRAGRLTYSVPVARRYLTDQYFKVRSSLLLSFFANLCYAALKLVCAVWYASFWEGALAGYNLLLCAVRAYLIRRVPADGQKRNWGRELRYYRTTGVFLAGLDLALGGIATQIVRDGQGYSYPGTLIFAVAAYAFYSLAVAIVNTVKFRRFQSPVLSAAKAVNLTTALVSVFNLETAMLAQFGQGQDGFRLTMTACTAFSVCAIVLGTAVFMVISASRKLRRFPA